MWQCNSSMWPNFSLATIKFSTPFTEILISWQLYLKNYRPAGHKAFFLKVTPCYYLYSNFHVIFTNKRKWMCCLFPDVRGGGRLRDEPKQRLGFQPRVGHKTWTGCQNAQFVPSLRLNLLLHCASLLRKILCMISGRALENGGFFFAAGPGQRGKSSFSWKRAWWPIIFFCCIELSSKFPYVKQIWANSQCWARSNRRKREFSKQSWCYL